MHDQALLWVVLGVLTVIAAVQAFALVGALRALRRLEERFGEAESELRAFRPRLERLGRVIDNVADWTDAAAEHIPRLAADIETALERIRWVGRVGALMLVKPLRPLGTVVALWKGLQSGARAYRELGPAKTSVALPPSSIPQPLGRRM